MIETLKLPAANRVDWEQEERAIEDFLFGRSELKRKLEWGKRLIAFDEHLKKDSENGKTLVEWVKDVGSLDKETGLDVEVARRYMLAAQFFDLDFMYERADLQLTKWGYEQLTRMPTELGDIVQAVAKFLGAPNRTIEDHIAYYEECVSEHDA